MKTLCRSEEYIVASRRIAGTHVQKLDQIDEAIQELLEIKVLECAADQPNMHFLAVPRRSHWFGMTMALLAMLALLILLLGVRPAHAQTSASAIDARRAVAQIKGTAAFFPEKWGLSPFSAKNGGCPLSIDPQSGSRPTAR